MADVTTFLRSTQLFGATISNEGYVSLVSFATLNFIHFGRV